MAAIPPVRAPLLSLAQALEQLLSALQPLTAMESLALLDADGRVLAQDLRSELHVPPWDNSAMDGYAVRCADVLAPGQTLTVTQRITAGSVAAPLQAGTAARIFTGAPLPAGADAVVMQEDCAVLDVQGQGSGSGSGSGAGDALAQVQITLPPQLGAWIRRAGEDVTRGAVVMAAGTRLGPAQLGLAASIGMDRLPVLQRPRVALFSTGDELVMPGSVAPAQMAPGTIYNANRYVLASLLRRLGCSVTDFGIVPDQRAATVAALREAAQSHTLILTSGGVSVGEEDHVKPAVQALGSLDLWQLAIKPGKPFAYGRVADAHFMGLPGNPVSSFVTFLLLVRPFLLRLQGLPTTLPAGVMLPAHFAWPRADRRQEFLRVRRNAQGGLDLFPNQSAGVLTSAVWGDGLVANPPGCVIQPGDSVRYVSFAELLA